MEREKENQESEREKTRARILRRLRARVFAFSTRSRVRAYGAPGWTRKNNVKTQHHRSRITNEIKRSWLLVRFTRICKPSVTRAFFFFSVYIFYSPPEISDNHVNKRAITAAHIFSYLRIIKYLMKISMLGPEDAARRLDLCETQAWHLFKHANGSKGVGIGEKSIAKFQHNANRKRESSLLFLIRENSAGPMNVFHSGSVQSRRY